MVDCDVSTANGKLRGREVGVPKVVIGLVLDVEWAKKGLLGNVLGSFGLDDGRRADDAGCGKYLLEGWLKAVFVDVVMGGFLADAIATKVWWP